MFECDQASACSNKEGYTIESSRFSISDQFDLYCDRSYLKNISIFMVVSVGGILYFFASCLSDKLGRRTVMRIGIVGGFIGFLLVLLSPGIFLTTAGLVLLALTVDTCYSLAFIYMSEIAPPRLRNISSLMMIVFHFSGEMLGAFIAYLLHNYKVMLSVFFILAIIMFAFYFSLNPTLHHLLKSQQRKEFLKLLNLMIKKNKVLPEYVKARLNRNKVDYFAESQDVHSEDMSNELTTKLPMTSSSLTKTSSKDLNYSLDTMHMTKNLELSLSDLDVLFIKKEIKRNEKKTSYYFKNLKNSLHLVAYALLVMNMYWVTGLTVFLPEKMGFDSIYVNTFFLASADLMGVSLMALFVNKTRRSVLNIAYLSMILVSTIILVILHSSFVPKSAFVQVIDIILSCKYFHN